MRISPSPLARRQIALLPWLLAMATATLPAQAQANPRAGPADPLDPKAKVPAVIYQTTLKPPGPAAADKPISWREANDTVTRIGGWRVYTREAQQPEPAPQPQALPPPATASPAALPATPKPPGHSGHSGHSGHKISGKAAP